MRRLQIAFCLFAAIETAYGAQTQTRRNIQAMTTNQAVAVLASFRAEREVAIQSLLGFFADKDNVATHPDVLVEVLHTAGSLRVTEVIPDILDNIIFQPIKFRDRFFGPDDYPAVKALIQIGFPAAKAVLARADMNQDQLTLSLYAAVVNGVLGREVGKSYVALMAKTNKDLKSFQIRYFPAE
jgi:hypothetical protein